MKIPTVIIYIGYFSALRLYQAMAPATLILLELSVILVLVVITQFYIVLNYRYFPVCKARGQTADFLLVTDTSLYLVCFVPENMCGPKVYDGGCWWFCPLFL